MRPKLTASATDSRIGLTAGNHASTLPEPLFHMVKSQFTPSCIINFKL